MPSSKPDSLKAQKLDHDSFVAFDHAAAGHDGVRCTLSGSLIAKPCTAEEVAFYESSALHPAFREFMPIYIGTLSAADQKSPLSVATAGQSGVVPESDQSSVSNTPVNGSAAQPDAGPSSSNAAPTEEVPWVPSAGRKIETGLSIVLENVASGFTRPNVLDVKLGARLWADDAHPSKRARLDAISKETTSGSLGFRIAGMKVWSGVNGETDAGGRTDPYETKHEGSEGEKGEVIEKDGYMRYDRWYGRSFNDENVKEGFETFLAGAKGGKIDHSKLIAKRLAGDLRNIQQVLEAEESRMYSSSALIVYEGDPEALEHALDEEKKAAENPPAEEDEDEEEEENFVLQHGGSFKVIDINGGEGDLSQNAINISIDPGTTQLTSLEDEEDEEEPPKVLDLRLIDFAHAQWTPGQGPDENVLMGVRSLIRIFDEIARS